MLSTSGDTHLGGDDFDKRIVDFLADDFKQNEGIDLRKDRQALQRLTEAAEKAKMELSSVAQTSISLPFITATADGPKHIESQMSRAKFESICSDLLDRCRIPVEQALKDAKLKLSDLNEVWSCQNNACLLAGVQDQHDCCISLPLVSCCMQAIFSSGAAERKHPGIAEISIHRALLIQNMHALSGGIVALQGCMHCL